MKTQLRKGVFLIVAIVFVFSCLSILISETAQATKAVDIAGKIITVNYGVWKPFVGRNAHLVIKGKNDKIYNVYTGAKTAWIPHKTPVVGDRVRCNCVQDTTGMYAGKWRALSVTYK